MSFLQKSTLTLTVTSSGAGTAVYTTVYNGLFHSVNALPSKAGTTLQTITVTAETTTRGIIKIHDPTTDAGTWYYPKMKGYNSSGASTALSAGIPLANERVRVIMAASSGTVSRTATVTIYIA